LQWGFPIATTLSLNKLYINQLEVKVVEVKTRASEAKGPFPGGKRVGSWGKKRSKRKQKQKAWGKHQRIYIRRSIRTDGLLAIKTRILQRILGSAVFYFEPMQ